MTTLDLPMPPSVNRIWRHLGKRVVRSAEYRQWQDEADALVLFSRARLNKIPGRFIAEVILDEREWPGAGDADNRLKPVLDFLQHIGVIENDRLSKKVSVEWGEADGAILRVWPVADQVDLAFTEAEAAMVDAAIARWASELGMTEAELEDRLGTP